MTMPPVCPNHGEFNEKINHLEARVGEMDIKQDDLRKPDGTLAKTYQCMKSLASKQDLLEFRSDLLKWTAILVTVFMCIVGGSFAYTGIIDTEMKQLSQKIEKNKERLDSEVVTKHDLEMLKAEMKECMQEIKQEIRNK